MHAHRHTERGSTSAPRGSSAASYSPWRADPNARDSASAASLPAVSAEARPRNPEQSHSERGRVTAGRAASATHSDGRLREMIASGCDSHRLSETSFYAGDSLSFTAVRLSKNASLRLRSTSTPAAVEKPSRPTLRPHRCVDSDEESRSAQQRRGMKVRGTSGGQHVHALCTHMRGRTFSACARSLGSCF